MKHTHLFRTLTLLLTAAILALSLAGCAGSGMTEDEIRDTFRSLVEDSYVLNEVYYGDGLPYTEDTSIMAQLANAAWSETFRVSYMPVAEDAPFHSEAEIREATRAVFSETICEHLFTLAFAGMSTENAETVSYARFIEESGILTVRVDLAEEAFPTGRTYDFDSMEIRRDRKNTVTASFVSYMDGEKSVDVEITIIKTADGWRLDSPTY